MEIRLSKLKRIDPILGAIILLAAFLNIYGIWNDQYSNAYYTAAVTSMLQNFHNFFFASLDPGGFVTVDKPRSPSGFKPFLLIYSGSMAGVSFYRRPWRKSDRSY